MINLKGGVGKTTLTVALAEFLSEENGEDVLVIDLDPQTNATVALISQERWHELDELDLTIAQVFRDAIKGSRTFDAAKAIVSGTSNLHGGIPTLHLLPSSLDLIELQDEIPLVPNISKFTINPIEILKDGIANQLDKYDHVLVDCPPNLGIITQNGLRISDWYLITVIPDILSTLGIPQILKQVEEFADRWGQRPKPLGIILSKVRPIRLHDTVSGQLRARSAAGEYPKIFDTTIRESSQTSAAMDFGTDVNTLKQKYGYGGYYQTYSELTDEFKGMFS